MTKSLIKSCVATKNKLSSSSVYLIFENNVGYICLLLFNWVDNILLRLEIFSLISAGIEIYPPNPDNISLFIVS